MNSLNRRTAQAYDLLPAPVDRSAEEIDRQILRISRLGRRLFGVPHCIITMVRTASNQVSDSELNAGVAAAFCFDIGQPKALTVVADASVNPDFSKHRWVTDNPHIRFYAAHPIFNHDRAVIGSVNLIDYTARAFSGEDGQLLADLAILVERELHFKSMNASRLDLEKKNKSLRRKSLTDPLIGTWNRGAIMRILTIEAIRCDKAGLPLSLIVADLDFFKKINDTYGHPIGDAVLVKAASRLRSCIRAQESLGRYGGEEFLIVLPGASQATAMSVAERMREAVASQPEVVGGATLNLTVSLGVSSTDLFPSATTEELINQADIALYAAKDARRNCVMPAGVL